MAVTATNVSSQIDYTGSKYVDMKMGPFASTADACSAIPTKQRFKGLTVVIQTADGPKDYWFESGTGNSNLVEKKYGIEVGGDDYIE